MQKWKSTVRKAFNEKEDLQQRWQGAFTEGTKYSCFGSVVTVVEIDCLTGEVKFREIII